jgi:hypothetical protein
MKDGPLAGRVAVVSGGGRRGRHVPQAARRAVRRGARDQPARQRPAGPNGPGLSPDQLHALLAESGRGEPREFRVSVDAFHDLMDPGAS